MPIKNTITGTHHEWENTTLDWQLLHPLTLIFYHRAPSKDSGNLLTSLCYWKSSWLFAISLMLQQLKHNSLHAIRSPDKVPIYAIDLGTRMPNPCFAFSTLLRWKSMLQDDAIIPHKIIFPL